MKQTKKIFNIDTAEIYQPDILLRLNEDVVAEKYPGSKLVGEFALSFMNDNVPIRWYKQDNPDRSKGHKDYFGLLVQGDQLAITGFDLSKIEEENERYRDGIHCLTCNTITYSRYRHDFHGCKCQKITCDGGPAYMKVGFEDNAPYNIVKIDLLTQKVVR